MYYSFLVSVYAIIILLYLCVAELLVLILVLTLKQEWLSIQIALLSSCCSLILQASRLGACFSATCSDAKPSQGV